MESLNIVIDEDFNYMCLDVLNENKLKSSSITIFKLSILLLFNLNYYLFSFCIF
jgi:hypothetical protein